MKSANLITAFVLVIVTLSGCKDDTVQPMPEAINEKLAFNVMELDHESMELAIQVGWLRGHLEKCLAKLEAQYGLEPVPFDWTKAMGFPKVKRNPNHPEWYTPKPRPFYVPYPTVKKSEINTEKYANPKHLSAYIETQLFARKAYMLGIDEYIKHLEERLKRIESHLEK